LDAREFKLGIEGTVLNWFENGFNCFLPAELNFCEEKHHITWEFYFRLETPVLDIWNTVLCLA